MSDHPATAVLDDEERLAELGYKQELHRGMSGFSNFAVSFSIISVLAGCITSYCIAMNARRPGRDHDRLAARRRHGQLCVALAMAEVCSVYPTAGGLYWWACAAGQAQQGRVWAWFVGWFNFLGEVAVTAGDRLRRGVHLDRRFLNLTFGLTVDAEHDVRRVPGHHRAARAAEHVRRQPGQGAVRRQRLVAPRRRRRHRRRPASSCPTSTSRCPWTFTAVPRTPPGCTASAARRLRLPHRPADGAVHVHRLRRPRPRGRGDARRRARGPARHRVSASWSRSSPGSMLLFAVTVVDPGLRRPSATADRPAAGADLHRRGRRDIPASSCCSSACVAQFFCGMASVTANSRMSFAFSRDGALPGSRLWAQGQPPHRNADELDLAVRRLLDVLVLPSLWNTTAYVAATSIAVIGLYIAYVMPVFLRLRDPDFQVGPWNLGRWSALIGWIGGRLGRLHRACCSCCRPSSPITATNFNYALVAVAVVVLGGRGLLGASAKHWFTGRGRTSMAHRGRSRRSRRAVETAGADAPQSTREGSAGDERLAGRPARQARAVPAVQCRVATGARRQRVRDHRRPGWHGDPARRWSPTATGCRPSASWPSGCGSAG